jgi:uncharacterized protein (DUF1501 family)
MLNRRELLQVSAALSLSPSVRAFAGPAPDNRPALVSIFLRGGMDALSFIAPIDDASYLADRAPELRLVADGAKPAIRLDGAPAGSDFRLHPEAAPLVDLYKGRRLAFVHAAGITNGTRSHFGAQELIDRGLTNPEDVTRISGGWITRWLKATGRGGTPAFAANGAVPQSLELHPDTICAPDLRNGLGVPGGKQAEEVLGRLFPAAHGGPVELASYRVLGGVQLIDQRLRGPDGKVLPYVPGRGATYEESEIGRSLMTVARVMRMDLGIRAYTVDMGGWDTHENQPPRFANLAGQLARALAAFHADLADREGGYVVVVMSEFGRRLRTNKSNGTDHGHGGLMMVLGPQIKGGSMHGRWPGLSSEVLDNRVDLAVTTDVRSVLAELMRGPLATGNAAGTVFHGFQAAPVGIVA